MDGSNVREKHIVRLQVELILIMREFVKFIAEQSAGILELAGIGVMIIIALISSIIAIRDAVRGLKGNQIYRKYRHQFARGILLGLEFLVAADIIHTVAVDLSFESVGVLAIVVLIRTFLSFTLEAEIKGKWPWQENQEKKQPSAE